MKHFILFFIIGLSFQVQAQQEQPILLENPSFEDTPHHSRVPKGWNDCANNSETPPDILPSGTFAVDQKPADGETYVGLVVRDNDTSESVGQQLSSSLQANECYEFSLSLCRSPKYVSDSRTTGKETNYTTPAKIRIYGGNAACDRQELLDETSLVISKRWLEHNFRFEPKKNHQYIIIEAFYKTPTLFPYNGNVLIDNASAIIPVPCDRPVPLFPEEDEEETEPIVEETPTATTPAVVATPVPVVPTSKPPTTTTVSNSTFSSIKATEIKKGQTIKLERLFFNADKATMTTNSYVEIDELYKFLDTNKNVAIEIGGHTNSTPSDEYCDKLSTERAKSVFDYLVEKGIQRNRLKYKGYGKRKPIASNKTAGGRKRNQRVEIKIR